MIGTKVNGINLGLVHLVQDGRKWSLVEVDEHGIITEIYYSGSRAKAAGSRKNDRPPLLLLVRMHHSTANRLGQINTGAGPADCRSHVPGDGTAKRKNNLWLPTEMAGRHTNFPLNTTATGRATCPAPLNQAPIEHRDMYRGVGLISD